MQANKTDDQNKWSSIVLLAVDSAMRRTTKRTDCCVEANMRLASNVLTIRLREATPYGERNQYIKLLKKESSTKDNNMWALHNC